MQIQATPAAQFFIHNEYSSVELEQDQVVISGRSDTVTVPFSQLSGRVEIERGIKWAKLRLFGYQQQQQIPTWVITGLDWQQAQSFARKTITVFEQWHKFQCRKLNLYLPKWHEQLNRLVNSPKYVKQSHLLAWREMIHTDLEELGYGFDEAQKRLPQGTEPLLAWLKNADALDERNQRWLEIELENWHVFFSQIERSPLNQSQQKAVLLDEDNTLVLAGAGTGKTSVITAKIAYLMQSHQASADQLVVLAFGNEASKEMRRRLDSRIGSSAVDVRVNTFHKLAMHIVESVEKTAPKFTSMASNLKQKQAWCSQWLREHWSDPKHFRRWQKHLSQWPIAYLSGDEALIEQVENPRLIAWLEQQLSGLWAENVDKKTVQQRLIAHPDYSRLNSELQLCWPAVTAWNQYLNSQQEYDFDSVIIKATQYLTKGKFKHQWKMIAVDEFQDISPMRLAFLQAIKASGDNITLFAVGDDWQSIYRFSGSDIAITTQFERRFSPSQIHLLDRSYRYNDKIAEAARAFIGQNPSQTDKEIIASHSVNHDPIEVLEQGSLFEKLRQLDESLTSRKQVLVLGRNHRHQPQDLTEWQDEFTHLSFEFMTCHASKGQEADFVVIVGVNANEFPVKQRTPHLVEALRMTDEGIEHAEERRLFYTALTRAKEQVFVCFDATPSPFINEILGYDGVTRG